MSSLTLNGDTSGSVILSAPAIAGSNTVTLPTTGGTIRTTTTPGTLLQIQNGNQTTPTSVASGAGYVATPLQATITPASTSNKIVISSSFQWYVTGGSSDATAAIYRNGSLLSNGVIKVQTSSINQTVSFNYVDSPASTSALTYRIYITNGGGTTMTWNIDGYPTSLILMEIAG